MKKISILLTLCSMMFIVACDILTIGKESESESGSIFGSVYDSEDNQPVTGASAIISPGSFSVITGSDGSFEFMNLDAGQYKLQVNKSGYTVNTRQITVTAGQNTQADIFLTPTAEELDFSINPTTYDFGTNSSELVMKIENTSTSSSLEWTSSGVDADWLSISPEQGEIALGKTAVVKIIVDRTLITKDEVSYFMINAGGGSESIAVIVSTVDGQSEVISSTTGIPLASENSEKPSVNESDYTITTVPSPTFKEESTNSNIIRMEFNGIQIPGTTGSSVSDFLQLFGTGNTNQNIWIEINGESAGFMVQNGSDLGTYEKAEADIIFLVDNSGSMGDEADKLANQIISWSSTISQTMDAQFSCVGYNGLITGAIDITDQNTLSSYLNESSGIYRTQHFGGDNAVQLTANASTLNSSASFSSQVECDPLALYFADENFSFRSTANRIYINMTDEYSYSPTEYYSVETINSNHTTYNWSTSQGIIHTVWSGGSYSSPTTYHSSEQPWLMSDYTGGTTKLDADPDFGNVDLNELPVTGAILYSYVVLIDNTWGIIQDYTNIKITIKSIDETVIVVSDFTIILQ